MLVCLGLRGLLGCKASRVKIEKVPSQPKQVVHLIGK